MVSFAEERLFPESCINNFPIDTWGLKPFLGYGREYRPGEKIKLHVHETDWHVLYILAGEVAHTVDNHVSRLYEGTIAQLGSGCKHELEVITGDKCVCLNIKLQDLNIPSVLEFPRWKGMIRDKNGILKNIIVDIIEELDEASIKKGSETLLAAKLCELLVQAYRIFEEDLKAFGYVNIPDYYCTRNRLLIGKIKTFLHTNYNKLLSIEEMANEVHLSPKYFCSLYKKFTGKGPYEYFCDVKIKKAKELLLNGKTTIKDVAKQVGFYDSGYFSRFFRKYTGISPSDYRNTHEYY